MKVLLSTDGSKHAEDAARLLSRIPHKERLELTVVSVTNTPYTHGAYEGLEWIKEAEQAEKDKAAEACQRVAAMFDGANVVVDTQCVEGHAGHQILRVAKERAVDMIVMGAQGHSMLSRMLLGSVSDFVATHAHCSVLIVRPTNLQAGKGSLDICMAYDGSESAEFTLSQLDQFQWHNHAKFDVVEVIGNPFTYTELPIDLDWGPRRQAAEQSVQAAAEKLKSMSSHVQSKVVESQHIGDAIARYANEHGSDMVVLGGTGLGLVGRFLLGSVANYVLRHADCSVWIAKKPNY